MEKVLTVTEQGRTRYVPGWQDAPEPATALARPVDVQRLTTDAMSANNAMVMAVLRQMQPQMERPPTVDAGAPGLSSSAELAARNQRFRWTVVAVVVLAAITAAGIVAVAYLAGHVSGPAAVAGWLTLSGVAGYLSVTYVHHKEAHLTPEALELERIRGDFDVASTDAESRAELARAYADAVRDDSAARRASAEAQRQANMAAVGPIGLKPELQRRAVQWQDDTPAEDAAPMTTYETAVQLAPTPTPAPAPAPDPVLQRLLAWVRETYDDCDRRDSTLITSTLPWAARSDWQAGDKERCRAVMATFDPPLIETRAGNRAHLNRQWRRRVAELHIAREWQ